MALDATPGDWEPIREQRRVRVGDVGTERNLSRDGVQQVGHGALVCPGCRMPVVIAGPISIADALRCGYCDRESRARDFVLEDVFDTVANEVYLVARVG